MPIVITKTDLIHIVTSSLFLLIYGLAMYILGLLSVLFVWLVYKTQAYKKPKRLFEAIIGITKHWDDIKEWW